MSRAETTAMLSKLVEKRLKNQTAFWASEVNFDRCEDAWCRMLDERNRMFDRYLTGMRCARYVLFGVWILAFAIVGLILVEVSS